MENERNLAELVHDHEIEEEHEEATEAEDAQGPQDGQRELRAINIEDESLPEDRRNEIVRKGIDFFRDVFTGIDDYTVFASTAMFLHGEKFDEAELQKSPGDLDISIDSKQSFREIASRLSDNKSVVFDAPSDDDMRDGMFFISSLDGAAILRGSVMLDHEGQLYEYPFEIFQDSVMVPKENRYRHRISGMNVLTPEGLKIQYAKNLNLEKRIDASVRELERFFFDSGYRTEVTSIEELMSSHGISIDILTEALDLSEEEIRDVYKLRASFLAGGNGMLKEKYAKELERIFGGLKTKIEKRRGDLETLQKLVSIE